MTSLAERFAAQAEALVGTPFRLGGRDPATGLDCIGIAACALGRAGGEVHSPAGYALRNIDIDRFLETAAQSGLQLAGGQPRRGDVLLVRTGPAQHHLLVALGTDRFVHAHAGLRRAVVQSGVEGWPVCKHWRLAENRG